MGFWIGAANGAAAMYFLDPEHGAQRRAHAREWLERVRPTVALRMETAQPAVRDLGGRVRSAAGRVPGLRRIVGGRLDEAQAPEGRPAVLASLTGTQMDELNRQFGEGDLQAWGALTTSYGWSPAEADEVWRWFEQRPSPAAPAPQQASGAA